MFLLQHFQDLIISNQNSQELCRKSFLFNELEGEFGHWILKYRLSRMCALRRNAAETPKQKELEQLVCLLIFDCIIYHLLVDVEGPFEALVQSLDEVQQLDLVQGHLILPFHFLIQMVDAVFQKFWDELGHPIVVNLVKYLNQAFQKGHGKVHLILANDGEKKVIVVHRSILEESLLDYLCNYENQFLVYLPPGGAEIRNSDLGIVHLQHDEQHIFNFCQFLIVFLPDLWIVCFHAVFQDDSSYLPNLAH